jgi:DNA-binding SARP family transcriptional activator
MLRCYLAGSICLLGEQVVVREDRLPGRQGRLAFAYLVSERRRAVPRDELAEVLWPGSQPRAWEVALSALVSKLRALLAEAGLGRDVIARPSACYEIQLPAGTWVDLEAAVRSVHEAEGLLWGGHPARAYAEATVAAAIARRGFLPGLEGSWIELVRTGLRETLLRALDCLAEVQTGFGQTPLALRSAAEAVSLEPYRETGYQRLMRAHLAAGDRAQALSVYERCREVLSSELGVVPTAATRAVLQEVAI